MDVALPKPGKYVIAVSGGVDSMVLLHILHERAQEDGRWKLTVAHLDHGIRPDSAEDRKFVEQTAREYGLPFVYRSVALGPDASEAEARKVRYQFLRKVRQAAGARGVLTAHHQDDLLETVVLNVLRGTGRTGLAPLKHSPTLIRPLLAVPKADIIRYADSHKLAWREDPTNRDTKYLRNYIRHKLLTRLSDDEKQRLLDLVASTRHINKEIDGMLVQSLHFQQRSRQLDLQWFRHLPHEVAREVMAAWLRAYGLSDFNRSSIARLVVACKVAKPGKVFDVCKGTTIKVEKDSLALVHVER